MRTHFTPQDLVQPEMQRAEAALRACVHCGLCNPVCPTYTLLGDELDSQRGRIQLIQQMLETKSVPTEKTVKHLDRCLTCLGCKSSCPSGVNFGHLIDTARAHIEETYKRPLADRLFRSALANLLPRPGLARAAMAMARFGRPLAGFLPARIKRMVERVPVMSGIGASVAPLRAGLYRAEGKRKARVALPRGCMQQVMGAEIDHATLRVLTRFGADVIVSRGTGCCGAIVWHMGKRQSARKLASRNLAPWWKEREGEGLDAIVSNASGCGTMIKDYGHMFEAVDGWSFRARKLGEIGRDVTQVLADLGFERRAEVPSLSVAWQAPCSMQHGLGLVDLPLVLLATAGFQVRTPAESHMCCGSAGTYSLTEPEISAALRARKVDCIHATKADVVASANIGCIDHLRGALTMPIVHLVELLDWASGGQKPARL